MTQKILKKYKIKKVYRTADLEKLFNNVYEKLEYYVSYPDHRPNGYWKADNVKKMYNLNCYEVKCSYWLDKKEIEYLNKRFDALSE